MKFCPNCGTKVAEDTEFCPNCGYQFKNSQNSSAEHHIYDGAENNDAQMSREAHNADYNGNYDQKKPQKHGHGLVITLIVIIVLLLAVGGYAAYKFVLTPGTNQQAASSSSSSSSKNSASASSASSSAANSSSADSSASDPNISANDANSLLSGMFSSAADDVSSGGDASDISDNFVDGTDNAGYQDLANWVHLQSNNDKVDSVTMDVQNLTTRGNQVNFQVKYDFVQSNGNPDHIQVFEWHGKMVNDGGNLMIQTLVGGSKPISDYDQN
ncbi:zinc-ribbon domain-containing protein [Nicoliella spurrieriana]|uniref:Zinc-ribbon domain-containing protein n=1 Tax=Nicoliella spurrieriana TaxID=2925830 RepID=A0A976X5U2_9LACO|nr:zinc-ribbon domain-containing protein [Nicoliella spurrieriana]UQS87270.1 zinc-ribbon domain-containing protein [Nicoliella spurrieriana]